MRFLNAQHPIFFMNNIHFDAIESLAVARLVRILIVSDGVVNRKESDFFEKMLQAMNVSTDILESSLSEPVEQTYEIIRNMTGVKRRECGRLLRLAISSDNVVDLSELSRLNDILENAALFRPDAKPMTKNEGGF